MNKCNQCHALFETPATETIMHYEVDTRREELIPVCPECGGDYFDEVYLCPTCNENYTKNDHCFDCLMDVSDSISKLANQKDITYQDAVELFSDWRERLGYVDV